MNLQFIDAGDFNRRLDLQHNQPVFDETGGYQPLWSTIATCWGQISPQKTGDTAFAQQNIPYVTHLITIRAFTMVKTTMRFVYRERCFNILGLCDPDESRRYLVCSVQEEN